MKINDDHLYHGSALVQIAEHPNFTSINAFASKGKRSENGFLVNDTLAVYAKYAFKPFTAIGEYKFGFTDEARSELSRLASKREKVVIALVCVTAREICGVTYPEVKRLCELRELAKGAKEPQIDIIVRPVPRAQLRVYVNQPGKRRLTLGQFLVPRSRFPHVLFE